MSGVPVSIVQLPTITPEGADSVPAWDQSSGLTGRATLTALGAIFALLTGAVFTGALNGTGVIGALQNDNGAGTGGKLSANRNPNASTPAAGVVSVQNMNGSGVRLWPDATNVWRTSTSDPTNATDTSGTVVGAQTSSLDQKDVVGLPLAIDEILAFVAEGAAGVRRFLYKAVDITDDDGNVIGQGPRPSGGEEFSGVIVDFAGRYGMDRDEAHPNGKSLNTINVAGDLLIAVHWLVEQNALLAARLAALEAGGGG